MKADAALGWPAGNVVPHAITAENATRPVVELDGKVHGDLTLGIAQDVAHGRAQVEQVGRSVVLLQCDLPGGLHPADVGVRLARRTDAPVPMSHDRSALLCIE